MSVLHKKRPDREETMEISEPARVSNVQDIRPASSGGGIPKLTAVQDGNVWRVSFDPIIPNAHLDQTYATKEEAEKAGELILLGRKNAA